MNALDSKSSGSRYGRAHALAALEMIIKTLGAPLHVKLAAVRDMARRFPGVGWEQLADEYAEASP